MSNKELGYVPLYRGIKDHWLWDNGKPFDEYKAWCDLLLSVNHKEKKININGRIQVIKPGQMWTSYQKLAGNWHWSKPRVLRYIKKLKSDGMVSVDGTPNGTLLTLMNWEFYNGQRNTHVTTDVTTDVTTPVTTDVTTDVTQTIMIKNGNNDKEVKKRTPRPPREGGEWQ